MDVTIISERTPLLGSGPLSRHSSSDSANQSGSARVAWPTYTWCILILVLTQLATSVSGAPYLRLLESTVCQNHYNRNDHLLIRHGGTIPEAFCKETSVQKAIALIQTLQQGLNFLAGVLASLHTSYLLRSQGRRFKLRFWGTTVERRSGGRRFILTLNLIAFLFSLLTKYTILQLEPEKVEWTWISSLFFLLAGGAEWRGEIIFMMIGDATSNGQNFQNTYTAIALQQVAAGVTGWGTIHLAAQLMTRFGVLLPLNIGLGILAFVILLVQFMPMLEPSDNKELSSSRYKSVIGRLGEAFRFLRLSATSVWLLISTYLVSSTFPQLVDSSLFEQYISTRFKNTIAQASQLQANSTIMNSIALVLSAFLLGKLHGSSFSRYSGWTDSFPSIDPVKDIYISRGTAIAQSIGFAIIGYSISYSGVILGLAFCAIGQPLRIATRCALLYMTYIPGEDTITGLFSIITFFDMLSGTGVNILLTLVFNRSLKLHGIGVGLPFFLAAFLLAIVAVIVFSVNFPPAPNSESLDSSTLDGENSVAPSPQLDNLGEAPERSVTTHQGDSLNT